MVFQRMFKTSLVVQQLHVKKNKARYMIVYGLCPAQKAKQTKINASPWLNYHQQKCQMHVNICYWDGERNVGQSVYYVPQFLQRPNKANLK